MDNALLEDRNAELLHISKLARQARGKKQALDPATQARLEALAHPVALSHPVGLDKKGTSKATIKDQASKRASGGSGRCAGSCQRRKQQAPDASVVHRHQPCLLLCSS